MDPHTAVATDAVNYFSGSLEHQTIILSTAHPAKFPEVFADIGISLKEIPDRFSAVLKKQEVAKQLNASANDIFSYIKANN